MTESVRRLSTLLVVIFIVCTMAACADSRSKDEKEFIVRVGDLVLTVLDFNKAFEIAKAAYPHNEMQDPRILKEAKLRLLNQITEEMIILKRAQELGIEITDEELNKAIDEIKKDYPDDVFQQTLLEHAVSYNSWEQGLKKRLLIKKVVEKELAEQITITPKEIAEYYEENFQKKDLPSDDENQSIDINKVIIKNVRRRKLEKAYKSWIKELRKKYTIEINNVQLKKIAGT